MTNRDRLKTMSDVKLVIFFPNTGGCPPKYTFGHCPAQDMPDAILNGDRCENCWFDWLKEEVEEDGNR